MTTKWKTLLLASVCTTLLAACGTSKLVAPEAEYETMERVDGPSVLTLPVRVWREELVRLINDQTGALLYEDVDPDSDLKMRIGKYGRIDLRFADDTIFYDVPLDIWLRQELLVGGVEAQGKIRLQFATRWQIDSSWQLSTQTRLSGYEWSERPRLKVAGLSLPITAIANLVLDKMGHRIAGQIDTLVQEQFALRQMVEEGWLSLHAPVLLSEAYRSWLLFQPERVGLTRPRTSPDSLAFEVIMWARPELVIGEAPLAVRPLPLPPLEWVDTTDGTFVLVLETSVPFEEAERMANEAMVGYTYTFGKRKATVEAISLYGKGSKLVVRTRLSGAYEGDVFFLGKPRYNAPRNRIELEEVAFDFGTRRFLMRSAAWLFKGYLRKQVEENLNFYLDYNLEEIKQSIQEQLSRYELAPGVWLRGELAELGVQHTWIAPEGIRVQVVLSGHLVLQVGDSVWATKTGDR